MTICFISPYAYRLFYPHARMAPFFGGAEVQQYQLAKALARLPGFTVHCIVGRMERGESAERVEGVWLHHAVRFTRRIPFVDTVRDFLALCWVMYRVRPHVVIVRGGGALAGKAAFIAKVLLRARFIFSSMHDRESSAAYWRLQSWYRRALFRYAIRSADIVICQHEGQAQGFKDYFQRTASVMPTMYAIPPEGDALSFAARDYVLWVGRLEVWKQPELFIDLARAFLRERFVLVTPGDASRIKHLAEGVTVVTIVGPVPFNSIDQYFCKAKVLVNTSRAEGFPNTFVQAAKSGTPILSLSVNPGHILERYRMGQAAGGDFARLKDNLAAFLSDSAVWQEASGNAYRYAAEHHDIRPIAAAYARLLASLCA